MTAGGQLFGAEALPQGSGLLVVKRGPNAGSRFLLDRATTTAGRHPNSNIFLDDVTVSRRHAEFRCVSGEFQVVDVGSLNGTYVNREPVDWAVLANGDEVQIGKFRLMWRRTVQAVQSPRRSEAVMSVSAARLNESRRALYYLATPPALFDPFVDQVDTAELREGTVVVVDSRFGRDLASAHPMDAALHRILDEHLALRVDLPA